MNGSRRLRTGVEGDHFVVEADKLWWARWKCASRSARRPVVCGGFAALLDARPDPEVPGTAANGHGLLDLMAATDPDDALVDVRMPVPDGITATRRIAEPYSTKALVLTAFDLDEYVYEALKSGVSGFLPPDGTAHAWSRRSASSVEGRCHAGRGPDAEIFAALHISVETVKSCFAEIPRKVGLRDRIQAVGFAYEKGLVFPGD